jgi:nitric oxide reductase NorE protein
LRIPRRHQVLTLPGEEGIWIFVLGDLTMFSLLFSLYLYSRNFNVHLFNEAQQSLNKIIGAFNTILLLTSSLFVVFAAQAVRVGDKRRSIRLLVMVIACGVGFVVSKVFEWGSMVGKGVTLVTNDFFMYYFVLTGIHLVHVVIGIVVWVFLVITIRTGSATATGVEVRATFWHMVDVIWVVLFAVVYLAK